MDAGAHGIRQRVLAYLRTNYKAPNGRAADSDDRVVPAHSYKYVAALQALADPAHPVLLRVDTRSGHAASNIDKQVDKLSDMFVFLMRELGVVP